MTNVTLSRSEHFKAFAFFAMLAVVYSMPFLKDIGSTAAADGYMNPHGFWWFSKALGSFRNPFYTDYFFYPQGANLAFHGGTAFSGFLLTLPISMLVGYNEAVNVAHFLGYLLCGYFTFLLAFDLTRHKAGAVIAGITFATLPYHYNSVPVHMITTSLQWIPLYLLMLKRMVETSGKKWVIASGLVFAVILLTDQMQTIISFLVTIILFVFTLFRREGAWWRFSLRREWFRHVVHFSLVGLIAAIAGSFYLYAFLDFLRNSRDVLKVGMFDHGGANEMSADLLGFLLPPMYNPFWGDSFSFFTSHWRNSMFLGYVPLVLSFIGVVAFTRERSVRIILAITVFSFIVTLGPTLHLNNHWDWNGNFLKLPFFFLSELPIFESIRTPFRFQPLTGLGIALLASYGVVRVQEKLKGKQWGAIIPYIFATLVLLEFFPGKIDYPKGGSVPKLYREMARDSEPYTVLELPLSRWSSMERNGSSSPSGVLYYQTVHNKRLFNGFISRTEPASLMFGDAILDAFKDVTTYDNYVLVGREKRLPNEGEIAEIKSLAESFRIGRDQFLGGFNVRYIVLHPPISGRASLSRVFVEEFMQQKMEDTPDGLAFIKL